MPRMATRSSNRRPGRHTGVATRGRDRVRRTRTMASAASLSLAPGGSGWSMPQLDGITLSHKVWRGDRVAATIGIALLRAGLQVQNPGPLPKEIRSASFSLQPKLLLTSTEAHRSAIHFP